MKIRRPFRFISAVLFLIILPVIAVYFYLTVFSSLPETMVPDVIGLDEKAAVTRIEQMGLTPRVESRNSASNQVSNQRPEPGRVVKTGRVILLIIGKPETENPYPSAVVVNPLLTPESAPSSELQLEIITQEGDKPIEGGAQ